FIPVQRDMFFSLRGTYLLSFAILHHLRVVVIAHNFDFSAPACYFSFICRLNYAIERKYRSHTAHSTRYFFTSTIAVLRLCCFLLAVCVLCYCIQKSCESVFMRPLSAGA